MLREQLWNHLRFEWPTVPPQTEEVQKLGLSLQEVLERAPTPRALGFLRDIKNALFRKIVELWPELHGQLSLFVELVLLFAVRRDLSPEMQELANSLLKSYGDDFLTLEWSAKTNE